jgi:toxin CptA
LSGLAAMRCWKNSPVGQLRWDGQVWHWECLGYQAGLPARGLSVGLDFQRILLLRLESQNGVVNWLWADRLAMPERWLDLRRAVYSRRKASLVVMPPDLLTPAAAADFPMDSRPPAS